jgi:signal peptidase II
VRVLYLSVAVVLADQATKLFVKGFSLPFFNFHHTGMELGASVAILGDALRLTYIENPGMAFGIDIGSRLFLTVFSSLASIGVFYYLYKVRDETLVVRASLALILGGAIGNLIDRIFYGALFGDAPLFYGKVVDFVDVNFLHLSSFGIFNLADAAVTTGVVLLLFFHRNLEGIDAFGGKAPESAVNVSPSDDAETRDDGVGDSTLGMRKTTNQES